MDVFTKNNEHFLLSLQRGESLNSSIEAWALENKIQGGQISGIGAICDAEIGYYHLPTKTYDKKLFTDEYELLSLEGNITLKDDKPFAHIHASFGDKNFQVFGGHLFSAKVAVVCEVFIQQLGVMPQRHMHCDLGLQTIQK